MKTKRRAVTNLQIIVRCRLPDPLLLHHFLTAFIEIKVIQYRRLRRMIFENVQQIDTLKEFDLEIQDNPSLYEAHTDRNQIILDN